jgi:5-(carboxyamino)imidazole ribonucleotide mutase
LPSFTSLGICFAVRYTALMKVTLLLGSKTDTDFAKRIAAVLDEFSVPSEIVVASAHKVPEKVVEVIEKLNKDPQPQVIITVVGMSNGLGGVAAGSCIHPVITCPPLQSLEEYMVDLHSSLRMPSEVPVMTVLNPKNAALSAVRILAEGDSPLQDKLRKRIEKIKGEY